MQEGSSSFIKLQGYLREMFQLDRGDLDFGIYRIMNQKRTEITHFLDNQLLPQVRESLEKYCPEQDIVLRKELEKMINDLERAGVDPESSPKVQELRGKVSDSVNITDLENDIYSHLYNFFKRYYSEGDFISQRRYKEGVYALPYAGEEVKLYWANSDQYYVKTSENFQNYTCTLPSGKKLRFELVEANTERNNNKELEGKERRFIVHREKPIRETQEGLTIHFEYRTDAEKRKQEEINKENVSYIFSFLENPQDGIMLSDAVKRILKDLQFLHPTEKNKERTLLEKYCTDYTAKNSFDYFIHKDLRTFLRRELDFYIKNEIMYLDDIEDSSIPKVESYLSKIKVLRSIAHKIIEFVSQFEEFQKKLWLKKKFVLETQYCITLDYILASEYAEELLEEIVNNKAQHDEWVRLFSIDEITGDMITPKYSNPLTVEFLKANDKLQVDTKFFSIEFKYKIVSIFDNLDEAIDGVLIHSENFQALNLLQERYREKVKCIYIDPPYNTGNDGFIYKDVYKHSSWLSFMYDRVNISREFLSQDGAIFTSIDDNEQDNLKKLYDMVFGGENYLSNFIWFYEGVNDNQHKVKKTHEYILCYGKSLLNFKENTYIHDNNVELSKVINNSIVKNGSKNPPKKVYLPEGFPCELKEAIISKEEIRSISYDTDLIIDEYKLKHGVYATSGWSSSNILEEFIKNSFESVLDSKNQRTIFMIKESGDIFYSKDRMQSYILSVLRNLGTTLQSAQFLENLFMFKGFSYPKPIRLIKYLININTISKDVILDYFAGSGTTGHAVINLNREDGGKRKYILVEMGKYFDTVTKPRVQKVAYSKEWKAGKPIDREGISHIIKYCTVEQYEDTLDNLQIQRTESQETLLKTHKDVYEEYMLKYMVEMETKESLLNIDTFTDPFSYTMSVIRDDATQRVSVDLIETFNYLIALEVHEVRRERNGIVTVIGITTDGEKTLVLWRNCNDIDNDTLDTWFNKRYSSKEYEFDVIYINGDNNIENMRKQDETWKVRLIEKTFKNKMFSMQDI